MPKILGEMTIHIDVIWKNFNKKYKLIHKISTIIS